MRSRPAFSAVPLALAALVASRPSLANGRFPAASQLVVDPGDATHLVLRTTYGIVQTMDGGGYWRWLCESSVGYGGIEDPAMGVLDDGTLLAGIGEGLAVSHDRGCDWAFAGGAATGRAIADVTVEKADASHAVALAYGGGAPSVLETLDGGATWQKAGVDLPADLLPWTIEVAPSDSTRLYVSGGLSGGGAVLERSDDRGASWTALPIDLGTASSAWIAGIAPNDPDRVYVRLDDASDRLVFTEDGGHAFAAIAATFGDMLGFALSPDGAKVAIGGPKDGVSVASTSDHAFASASATAVNCLAWGDGGLYACGIEAADGFTVGLSTDEGATFAPLHHLSELCPLECPAGSTTATACDPLWPATVAELAVPGSYTCPPLQDGGDDAGAPDATPVDAHDEPLPLDAGAEPAPEASDLEPSANAEETSCGCRVGPRRSDACAWSAGIVAIALAAWRRRSRRA